MIYLAQERGIYVVLDAAICALTEFETYNAPVISVSVFSTYAAQEIETHDAVENEPCIVQGKEIYAVNEMLIFVGNMMI